MKRYIIFMGAFWVFIGCSNDNIFEPVDFNVSGSSTSDESNKEVSSSLSIDALPIEKIVERRNGSDIEGISFEERMGYMLGVQLSLNNSSVEDIFDAGYKLTVSTEKGDFCGAVSTDGMEIKSGESFPQDIEFSGQSVSAGGLCLELPIAKIEICSTRSGNKVHCINQSVDLSKPSEILYNKLPDLLADVLEIERIIENKENGETVSFNAGITYKVMNHSESDIVDAKLSVQAHSQNGDFCGGAILGIPNIEANGAWPVDQYTGQFISIGAKCMEERFAHLKICTLNGSLEIYCENRDLDLSNPTEIRDL